MKILKNQGQFNVLATWPSEETNSNCQNILEKVGRTCYQSEKNEITIESSNRFCRNLLNRTHFSVFEHGWRGYIIYPKKANMLAVILELFWPVSKFLFITERYDGTILVSANLETWRKLLHKKLSSFCSDIVRDLSSFAPAIFSCPETPEQNIYIEKIEPINSISQLRNDREILTHVSHTVQYNQHSRGFTHELVRHRVAVFSQESTRYVDEKEFEFVLPPHKELNETSGRFLEQIEKFYIEKRQNGWRPEDARQFLPTAIVAQIVMSCNLQERRYIYYRRASKFAHWEIRKTMCNEFLYFSKLYPTLFNMFSHTEKNANDGLQGYCEVNQQYEFFCNE